MTHAINFHSRANQGSSNRYVYVSNSLISHSIKGKVQLNYKAYQDA